jgi:peptidoglycan hydrolase-like protein with peptidoglycan-binding domain
VSPQNSGISGNGNAGLTKILISLGITRNLTLGMEGEDVRRLQKFLISQGLLAQGFDTGTYGPLTVEAVRKFQITHNLIRPENATSTVPGVVGIDTRIKIDEILNISVATTTVKNGTSGQAIIVPVAENRPVVFLINRGLYVGSSGEDVKFLQQFLIGQKLLSEGLNTGIFGPLTREAVRKFQVAHGIVSETDNESAGAGLVGGKTRAKIRELAERTDGVEIVVSAPLPTVVFALSRGLHVGVSGDDVAFLQKFLGAHGFLSATSTGFFGPLTREAVRKFQVAHGIVSETDNESAGAGLVGVRTRAKIREIVTGETGSLPVVSPIPPLPPPQPVSSQYMVGDEVVTAVILKVRAEPSISGVLMGKSLPKGTKGKMVEGPVRANDFTWWKVEYENGDVGWSVEHGFEDK